MDNVKIGEKIKETRKRAGLTQEALAEKVGVTPQAVSKWENGHNLPDRDNQMIIAEITNTPYAVLMGDETVVDPADLDIRVRLFREENMYTRLKSTALNEKLDETYKALSYMRDKHAGVYRKESKYTTERVQYINHPLMMACQAHALGIREDALLAAILLHDVVEDTPVTLDELPFSDEVKTIVGLVSLTIPEGMTKAEAKTAYYKEIAGNGKACMVKIIDRCNNVSTMAGSFSREKMLDYIRETEEYILPLTTVIKNQYPEYSDAAFVVKYHIISVIETIKSMMTSI